MKTIAIAAGGDSSEFEISVKSAREVEKVLSGRYRTYIILMKDTTWYWEDPRGRAHSVDKNSFTLKIDDEFVRFDAVFIAIHGTPGENGLLQGYLDMIRIPYTSCNPFCSSLTFNKQACKLYLKEYGVPMARNILVRKARPFDPEVIAGTAGMPCFVKPNDSGSSFGVSKVNKVSELVPAINKAFSESDEVMIESYMKGREVACGIIKAGNKTIILPVTEIISKNEFFDYEAKYTPGKSEEITPADLPSNVTASIQELSSEIYDHLGCKGIVRVDFIVVGEKPFFLEINTVPGMTRESIIPKQAEAAGIDLADLYSMVIENLFA